MITATIAITPTSTSLYDLINVAQPNKLRPTKFNGRVAEIQIHWLTGSFHLFDMPGVVDTPPGPTVAANSGYQFGDDPATNSEVETLLVLRQGGLNGLNLNEVFLGTPPAGAGTARILAYSV